MHKLVKEKLYSVKGRYLIMILSFWFAFVQDFDVNLKVAYLELLVFLVRFYYFSKLTLREIVRFFIFLLITHANFTLQKIVRWGQLSLKIDLKMGFIWKRFH